jgi:hypothetical protein
MADEKPKHPGGRPRKGTLEMRGMPKLIPIHGKWHLDLRGLPHLAYGTASNAYAIAIDELGNAALVLDAIAQIAGKIWVTAADLGDFVRAIDHLLGLQARLCGQGRPGEIADPVAVALTSVRGRSLPSEEPRVEARARELTRKRGHDPELGVVVADYVTAEREVVEARRARWQSERETTNG